MSNSQHSIHHDAQSIASDIAVRTQQAEARHQMDTALSAMGRLWEDHQRPSTVSPFHREDEEVYVIVDLTSSDSNSCAFVESIFPYSDGDKCIWLDLEHAQAILHLTHIAATPKQLDVLEHTTTIVGYAFKTRAEIAQRFPALFAPHEEEFEQRQPLSGRMGVTF